MTPPEPPAYVLDVTAGWEWLIRDHPPLSAELGGAFTLGATAQIEPEEPLRPRIAPRRAAPGAPRHQIQATLGMWGGPMVAA